MWTGFRVGLKVLGFISEYGCFPKKGYLYRIYRGYTRVRSGLGLMFL